MRTASRKYPPVEGDDIRLRPAVPADLPEIAALIGTLTRRYLSADLSAEGLGVVQAWNRPGAMGRRWAGYTFPRPDPALVATCGAGIVGYGGVRERTHITQLFIADDHRGRGVGYRLAMALLAEIRARHPHADRVTLNAAPSAHAAYLRMGFETAGTRWVWRGIPTVPMVWRL